MMLVVEIQQLASNCESYFKLVELNMHPTVWICDRVLSFPRILTSIYWQMTQSTLALCITVTVFFVG